MTDKKSKKTKSNRKRPKCKGSLVIGNACRQCHKCFETIFLLACDLSDSEPCRYDHNQFCQVHYHNNPCPNEVMNLIKEEK